MVNPGIPYSILQRHLSRRLLEGYLADIIDEENRRLYAVTFNSINPDDYEKYSFLHDDLKAHSVWGADEEKTRIYTDEGRCYYKKDTEQCIREGIYHAFSMKFYGYFYEGRWYILKELAYFGEHMKEEDAKKMLLSDIDNRSILDNDIYLPIEPHFPVRNHNAPKLFRGVEFQEFVGIPELVVHIKQEEKLALCQAFTHFMNLDVFIPFLDRLKEIKPDEYFRVLRLYPNDYTMIFPASRKFILIPTLVMNLQGEYQICYFFWHAGDRKMYRWTYFAAETYGFSFFYGTTIIEDLSKVCYWDNVSYLNSSCTLDDDNFWNTYVLAKDEGRYKYLSPLISRPGHACF